MKTPFEHNLDGSRLPYRLHASFAGTRVMKLLAEMPGQTLALVFSSIAGGLAEAGILGILAEVALVIAKHQTQFNLSAGPLRLHASASVLLLLGAALTVVKLILGIAGSYVSASISTAANVAFRRTLFEAFTGASWSIQAHDREGHFQDLITNQITGATQAYSTAAQLVTSLLTFMVLVLSAVALSPYAAIGIVVLALMLSAGLRPLANLGQRRAHAVSEGWLAYAGGITEAVSLAEETHVFGAADRLRGRQDHLIEGFRRPSLQVAWLSLLVASVYQSLIYLLLILSLLVLYALAPNDLGTLGIVVLLLVRSGSYGQQVQAAIQNLRQSQPYVERLEQTARNYQESTAPPGATTLDGVHALTLKDVAFSYRGQPPSLRGVNIEVPGGATVGVVGPSGAGKSTLVQILLGLREPSSGEYLVNGRQSWTFTRESWRAAFAYVPQEPRLLHTSVADNIRFFRDISDDDVESAAVQAGIHDDILNWSAGYQTVVGPRADAVSGGQQQRICLARALAGRPSVLILDEPTSALDPLAEQVIQASLKRLRQDLTLIIVAHRMSTLEICERILVIVDGQVQAFGSMSDLLTSDGYYRSALTASTTVRLPQNAS